MDERGQGYVMDMLMFALMVAFACSLLVKAGPAESSSASDRYAVNLARSTLLAFQHATASELGGLKYNLGSSGIKVPWSSGERNLRHKTLAQLLVEDMFCNLHIEVGGRDVAPLRPNQGLDDQVRKFMKTALDKLIGGRFNYHLSARSAPIDLSPIARVHFETSIESSGGNERGQLYSETIFMNLPIDRWELASRVQNICPLDPELKPDVAVEITLSLWPR